MDAPTPPRRLGEGIWVVDAPPIDFLGFPYVLRTTLVRVDDGSLLVHSPCQLNERLLEEISALGRIGHLMTPNKLHNVFLGEWADRFPSARVYLPPGLAERRPDLRHDAVLTDDAPDAWSDVVEQIVVGPSLFMDEVVLFHRPSATLILGDLIEDHDPDHFTRPQRAIARINGMFGTTPVNYRVTFLHRKETRKRVRQLLAFEPARVVVMHGPIVEENPKAYLEHGFAWIL